MRPTISTASGDKGKTTLYSGKRVSKASERIQAYGDIDELNAILGLILSEEVPRSIKKQLIEVQHILFTLGADLATPVESSMDVTRVGEHHVAVIEKWGEKIEKDLPKLTHFILPSGSKAGSMTHLARTVCRRAERWMVELSEKEVLNEQALIYVNRLSDYLFLVARAINYNLRTHEIEWSPSTRSEPLAPKNLRQQRVKKSQLVGA